MKLRMLSPTGDMQFGQSSLNYQQNTPEAVAQNVQTKILLILGEWPFDTSVGFPLMQGVIGKYSQETRDSTIKDFILAIDNVVSLDNYQSTIDPVTRRFSVTGLLNTTFGVTALQIQNYRSY